MSQPDDLVTALAPVVLILNKLQVRHYVGGSVASSFHGAVRSTMDVDIVCELNDKHVAAIINGLGAEFYANEQTIREAIKNRSCFNLIHLSTSFKVDVFVSRGRAFDIDCMNRSQLQSLSTELEVAVATPEDSIIAKLEWYRIGNEVSDRQWDDVTRLLRLLADQADWQYLKNAAALVNVEDLLQQLRDAVD